MTSASEVTARRQGQLVTVLRYLAAQLASEKSAYSHIPMQLVSALLEEPVGGCRTCGAPLPVRNRTGRPRLLCTACSPKKTSEKSRVAA